MNKQAQRSQEWIIQAFFDLLRVKAFADITVSEIAKRAGISRLTYYRHFETKEDIIQRAYDIQYERYLEALTEIDIQQFSLYETLLYVYEYWLENMENLRAVIKNGLTYLIVFSFSRYVNGVLDKIKANHVGSLELKYIEGGIFGLLLGWAEKGYRETPAELAQLTVQLIENSLFK